MNAVTMPDPTNSEFVYLCDWVAVTPRGYSEEHHECESLSALLEFINIDDENWEFQPRLRIRRMPSWYAGNIRAARDDNWLEEVYWTPGTPSKFKSYDRQPQDFIVPERFVREVAETPAVFADPLLGLLHEVLAVHGADADEEKGLRGWHEHATRLEDGITAVLKAAGTSGAHLGLQAATAVLRALATNSDWRPRRDENLSPGG
jgi:hypothetical protein